MLINYLILFRVKHWIKNLIIFTPLIFASKFHDKESLFLLFQVFGLFCLLSSTIYVFNDICDFKEDSKFEIKKKEKPIANNKISLTSAKYIFSLLIILDLVLLIYLNKIFFYGICFLILNIFYSILLKKIIIIDSISISFSYLIRVFSGAVIVSVPVSPWLYSLVFFVSLFVVFSKRYSEVHFIQDSSNDKYEVKNKKIYLYLLYASLIVSLAIYTFYIFFKNTELILTIPLTFLIFFRMIVNLFKSKSKIISPVNTVLNDKWLFLSLILWSLIAIFPNFVNNLFF